MQAEFLDGLETLQVRPPLCHCCLPVRRRSLRRPAELSNAIFFAGRLSRVHAQTLAGKVGSIKTLERLPVFRLHRTAELFEPLHDTFAVIEKSLASLLHDSSCHKHSQKKT